MFLILIALMSYGADWRSGAIVARTVTDCEKAVEEVRQSYPRRRAVCDINSKLDLSIPELTNAQLTTYANRLKVKYPLAF